MTRPNPAHGDLGAIIRQARHLVLDFDGVLCTLYTGEARHQAADQLRAMLTARNEHGSDIAASDDPLAVLEYMATIGRELAEEAEAELTRQELAAVPTAQAMGYSHDLITTAREGNRTVAIISRCSADTVHAYLDRASLRGQVALVVARGTPHPVVTWDELIRRALAGLGGEPDDCALIARSADLLDKATAAGMPTISYSPVPASGDVTSAQADATVISFADLVLQLRARPLPK